MSSSSNYYSSDESFDMRYEALKCDCGLRAAIRVTESNKPSKGRLYFICEKRNCQFWRWCILKSRYPDVVKFRRMPLQFADDLDILFSDVAVTGEWAYTPSSGVMPQTDETLEEFHAPYDTDLEVVYPSELNKKRSSNTDGSSTKSKTKKKFSGAALLNKTLDRIINVVESSSATSTQTSSRYPSIAEYLAKLESIPSVSPNNELYVWAARLFLRDKRRECFMSLPTDEVRLRFLKLEIEMKKTTTSYRG
ncbi:L10-interacting MYB domain-containing protein [Camellia lanceoleosa]|nr:L10-interacting MYB domain-containing protein [Camellia lanceoleosa]